MESLASGECEADDLPGAACGALADWSPVAGVFGCCVARTLFPEIPGVTTGQDVAGKRSPGMASGFV